ncbi:putative lysophospholipase [Corynebacterium minutissimum]|uniref:Putative lysophospholipase n=2 Tax=Corynebacterium minutissimum TaxID=38301 RepID=A0A376CZX5_9CORY|nr:putative lysophospholipase [Corynebacterium minutissimum]
MWAMTINNRAWTDDILGPDFQSTPLELGVDPDGEGDVRATLVRYCPGDEESAAHDDRPAIVWVHGMTDYFFHTHVAEYFYELGYAFYAVDLRKCGRSRQEGQAWHYISDLRYYDADLNAALDSLPNPSVVILGHSTAGTIVALWLDRLRRTDSARFARIAGVILNSPWLAMMGISDTAYEAAKHVVYAGARIAPRLAIPGGDLTAYGESVHASHHGDWDYDLALKPLGGHEKYLGWLAAVFRGFDAIHSGHVNIGVPLLTMTSHRSELGKEYSESSNTADTVVDTRQSQRWAKELSPHYSLHVVRNGRHDLFLSQPEPLDDALSTSAEWLRTVVPAE